ncbi:MAG: hypothetical protein IK130_12075 [Oscillospiraceae bacterium]|nr:hypothetical protein [Oscillospiraceae bacterium]
MKRDRILAIAMAAMLLTACSNQTDSSVPSSETTVPQTTAAAATTASETETSAGSETAVSSVSAGSEAVSQTASTASPALSSMTTVTTTVLSAASSDAAQTTAGNSAGTQLAQTTKAAAQTTKPAVKPTVSAGPEFEEITLNDAQRKVIDELITAMKKEDHDTIYRVTNFKAYIAFMKALMGDTSAKDYEKEAFDSIDPEDFASYKISYSARRQDLLKKYDEMFAEFNDELADMQSDEKQQIAEFMSMASGVTDIVTVEMDYVDAYGDADSDGIALFCQNGEWKVDLFVCKLAGMPLTREEVLEQKQDDVTALRSSFKYAYKNVKKNITSASVLENRDIVWKADMLENSKEPEEKYKNDPMENLRYQVHKRCEDLADYAEIRFLLSEDDCLAVAAQRKDGFIWCAPSEDDDLKFSSLDEAFAHAKEQAKKKQEKK